MANQAPPQPTPQQQQQQPQQQQPQPPKDPNPTPAPNPEDTKPDVKKIFNIVGTANFGAGGDARFKPLKDLADDLPSFPTGLHRFQDPRHPGMRAELEKKRILLLTSYRESAAYA